MADLSASSLAMTSGGALLTLTPSKILALQAVWATFPATMPTTDKLVQLNNMRVAGPAVDVQRSEIVKLLKVRGTLDQMQAYVANPATATQPCLTATNYILVVAIYEATIDPTLRTSDPQNLDVIEYFVPDLLADPNNGMSADILAAVMALIRPLVPWWKANGFAGPILTSDLISAGNLF